MSGDRCVFEYLGRSVNGKHLMLFVSAHTVFKFPRCSVHKHTQCSSPTPFSHSIGSELPRKISIFFLPCCFVKFKCFRSLNTINRFCTWTNMMLACERRRISGCNLVLPKITTLFSAKPSDSRKYVCVRRLI